MFSKKLLMPVIHVESKDMSLIMKNVDICTRNRIKAIWLISHSALTHNDLIDISKEIKKKYPTLWIGCNFLDFYNDTKVFSAVDHKFIDGIWIDNTYLGVDSVKAEKLYNDWIQSEFKGLYFGGFAFKYCEQPKDYSIIPEIINKLEILTTSGNGTGEQPSLEKIKKIRSYIPECDSTYNKIAVASGISFENIKEYISYVDYFIVSSSIEDSFGVLNEEKVRELSDFILEYNMKN